MNAHRRTQRAGTGFTLVEILAVIAVIALLIALLLTALAAVRRQGDLTQTLNNLRQVGQWLGQYGMENRDHIVPSQFDYSVASNPGLSYSGKVRSLPPGDPEYGQPNQGTWTDIIWTTYELGAFPAAATQFSGNDYRYDSPDKPLYDLLDEDIGNPLRAGALNRYDAINGDFMLPYGSGALERGYPGFLAANDFFNARPDAPDDTAGNPPPPGGRWYTFGQIKFPDQALYAVDSYMGEVIAPLPAPYDAETDANGDGRPDTLEVDFRYSGSAAILFLDFHVAPEGQWKNLDELELDRRIRVRDLTVK
jgi:prepilin-type N-terminal cleavage/methylation domain-containing protein